MTLREIEAVLRFVEFPMYVFHVAQAGDRYWLQATFYAHCAETGEPKRQHTRKWYVSNQATRSEVVQTALKCVLTYRRGAAAGSQAQLNRGVGAAAAPLLLSVD